MQTSGSLEGQCLIEKVQRVALVEAGSGEKHIEESEEISILFFQNSGKIIKLPEK
jgi:hypothetical protein